MAVELIPLSPERFEEIVELAEEVFPYDKSHVPCPREGLRCSIEGRDYPEDHERNGRYWYVLKDGKLAGFTGLYVHTQGPDDVAWLGWFGVAPEVRGNGIGRKMLQATIDRAQYEGYKALRLYTTSLPGEEVAQRLYEEAGFMLVDRQESPRCTTFYMEKVF